jgi:nucleoside-diphosphate-sugar epimerase
MGLASAAELPARLAGLWGRGDRPLITRLQVLLLALPFRVSSAKANEQLGYHPQIGFAQGIDGLREYVRGL